MDDLKFLADGMLGKLTRWLRILGQDVRYSRSSEDEELLRIAKTGRRVILTRDLQLYQQAMTQGLTAFLVEGAKEAEKLAGLARRFDISLEFDSNVSRCPKCNSRIKPISKDEVMDKIPEATASYYETFWVCSGCAQVYWQGSHWKRINKTLSEAKETLEKS